MRKLIWRSSLFAFVPVLAGLVAVPFYGDKGWWSLAAGGAFAALAFGAFLEIAQNISGQSGFKNIFPVILPIAALLAVGALGAVAMDALSRHVLRPESFVAGLVVGTLLSQAALIVSSQRLSAVRQ